MNVVDYLLDGLEAELELERELGVRTVECDRALLDVKSYCDFRGSRFAIRDSRAANHEPRATNHEPRTTNHEPRTTPSTFDFVFVHHAPLSPAGNEMMAKIIVAMGRTDKTAPVIVAPPLPQAKIVVVLGGLALKRFYPGLAGSPGQWKTASDGTQVLVTYSPEYILRFEEVTDSVQKIKREMWTSLKGVVQRLNNK